MENFEFISLQDAREQLGVSRQFFYHLRAQNKLKFYKLNTRVFFRRDELKAIIQPERRPAA